MLPFSNTNLQDAGTVSQIHKNQSRLCFCLFCTQPITVTISPMFAFRKLGAPVRSFQALH